MEVVINCLYVGLGGFLGSIFRYILGFLPLQDETGFPYVTLLVNVIGAFFIGFFVLYISRTLGGDRHLLLFLRVGLCGGFTTFSAFTIETLGLFQDGSGSVALLYIISSVVLCLLAAVLGEFSANEALLSQTANN